MAAQGPSFTSSIVPLVLNTYHIGSKSQINVTWDSQSESPPAPVKPTVLLSLGEDYTKESIHQIIESFHKVDDVFCDDFLTDTVLIQRNDRASTKLPETQFKWSALNLNTSNGLWNPSRVIIVDGIYGLPAGPYFLLSENTLAQAWRLYPDRQDAFTTAIVPSEDAPTTFRPLNIMTDDGIWRQVAVPSRLYSTPTSAKPLAGLRISIKDNFKLTGIRTTQNNRAWTTLYGPDQETASYVELLVQRGAVIVGKTKMNAFASSEEATDQWIDFHAPFTPRADEYQSPSGSTTGGSCALASYDWLDYSIGTDTTGSIRWPAATAGLYGLRTSYGVAELDGVYPSCRSMDTIGLLSRSIVGLQNLVVHSIPSLHQSPDQLPERILYCTDFLPHENAAQQALVDTFVNGLEAHLGVGRTNFSILERWSQCPPSEAEGKDLKTYTNKTAYSLFYYDGYNEYSQFREEYKNKFGKPPFLGPYMQWKWDRGAEVTLEQKVQAEEELAVYRRWFKENVMSPEANGGSNAILILPCGSAEPKYRDLPNGPPKASSTHNLNYISSMHSLPQIVVPVGQLPYESRISKRTEYLPIAASMASAQGSDSMLVSLAKAILEKIDKPTKVQTGRFAWKI